MSLKSIEPLSALSTYQQASHEATTFPPFINVLLKATAGPLLRMLPVDIHMLLFPGISANVDEMWAHALA